jgi:putative (di)nucleoside polyphosphate hydrolase
MNDEYAHLPFRPCAGVMLINGDKRIFTGQRLDSAADAWQMPQGGIDPGETPEQAAIRELGEETGIAPHLAEIVARSAGMHRYDLPPSLMGRMWGGAYRGQEQHWFVMRFLGRDDDVNLATAHPEFRSWRWVDPAELVDLIVPFKRDLYRAVLDEFADFLR